eukprot:6476324-Amphidinium_carterae.1
MYPKCRDMQWENVSGHNNLCFWRCAQRQLAAANHAHKSKEPEEIKQLVMAHALANADRIAQDTGFDTTTFVANAQQTMQRCEMATEHCIAAFVDFYQVRVLVMHKEHQAAWIYIPAGETMAGPSMLVWLHQQHFQSGPTFDLAQINHAISSNADEQAFKSFCLRGGAEESAGTFPILPQMGVGATGCVDAKQISSASPPTPVGTGDRTEDSYIEVERQRAPHCSMVPNQDDANKYVLAGDSIAMNVIMLITSDLCRQVLPCTNTQVCDTCKPATACGYGMQQPTPDKGTWPKWMHELMMHAVHLVSDFQPPTMASLNSTHIGQGSVCSQRSHACFRPHSGYLHLTACDPPIWSAPEMITMSSPAARLEPTQQGRGHGASTHHDPLSLQIGHQCCCRRPPDFHSTPGRLHPIHTRDITPPVMDAWSLLAR